MATSTNPAITFAGASQAQVGNDATWISGWTAQNGGSRLFKKQISNNPDPLILGQPYQIAAGQIVLTFPRGEGDENLAERAANGAVLNGIWIQLHSNDPGSANSNALTIPRVSVAQGQWVIAAQ